LTIIADYEYQQFHMSTVYPKQHRYTFRSWSLACDLSDRTV